MTQTRPRPRPRDREPAARRGRPGRWKALFVTLLVCAVLGASGWVLLGSRLLVVRHVEVSGTELAPRDRVVAAAGVRLGVPMVRLGTGDVRARVERLAQVESARVERSWPATIRIRVRERVPIAAVARNGRHFQLDKGGVTVLDGVERPAALPLLTVAAPGPSDPSTLAALRVVRDLPAPLRGTVAEVAAPSPEAVSLRLRDGVTIVWGSPDRSAEKARLAAALLRSAGADGPRTVDVSSPDVVTTR
ncbi:cell division protein FtsQ/DivIB [Actinomadura flavalba]|uniref:cell division protein FtsQ/DivIB n=1 Tax=Actinomadura flavalba TaxID=1120938 RepID=UPI0009DB88DC|nr:FtsQ-type POTRA domain-containing protein [Actinomadura flavalba]